MRQCDHCPAPATVWISAEHFESPRCTTCGQACVAALQAKGKTVKVLPMGQPVVATVAA